MPFLMPAQSGKRWPPCSKSLLVRGALVAPAAGVADTGAAVRASNDNAIQAGQGPLGVRERVVQLGAPPEVREEGTVQAEGRAELARGGGGVAVRRRADQGADKV